MGEFMTMEEAATQLEVSEATLRQWIQRGRARASRRGGTYVLRIREVERLAQAELGVTLQLQSTEPAPLLSPINLKLGLDLEPGLEGDARPRRALPPRPREPGDDDGSGRPDRRKRSGRRQSDFSLEILSQEVRQALEQGLAPLLESQESFLREARTLLSRPAGATPPPLLQVLPQHDPALLQEVEELRQIGSARERQLRHSQQENVQLRQRMLELEGLRDLAVRNQELTAQLAAAQAHGAELALEQSELRTELRTLRLQSQAPRPDPALEQALQAAQQELELIQRAHHETLASSQNTSDQLLALERELLRERQNTGRLNHELEELRRGNQDVAARVAEAERVRAELAQSQELIGRYEAERLRLATEFATMRAEAEGAWEASRRAEEQRNGLHEQLTTVSQQLERAQSKLAVFERDQEQTQRRFDEREQQLTAENRRLKEQLTELQYRAQMADSSHSMANLEDSRRMMDQLVELQNAAEEKDRQIAQGYNERSDLRSKLEEVNRSYYELQHRYEKEKEEWSQVVARQIQMSSERERAQLPPAPSTLPDKKKSDWGKGLFKLKGDV